MHDTLVSIHINLETKIFHLNEFNLKTEEKTTFHKFGRVVVNGKNFA